MSIYVCILSTVEATTIGSKRVIQINPSSGKHIIFNFSGQSPKILLEWANISVPADACRISSVFVSGPHWRRGLSTVVCCSVDAGT